MSPYSTDPRAFKRASQAIAKLPGAAPLSSCQTALAQASGHRDFHHVQALQAKVVSHPASVTTETKVEIVSNLAKLTTLPAGELLNVLVRERFFGTAQSVEGTLAAREGLFALQYPVTGRDAVGAPCRLQPSGSKSQRALVVSRGVGADGLSYAMTDQTIALCVSHEMPAHRAGTFFVPMRFWMPYGVWTEEDGSQVIFSRDYCPLWKIEEGRAPVRDDPNRWVRVADQRWFFDEGSFRTPREEAMARGLEVLRKNRIVSLPRLVEWLPECLAKCRKISELKKSPWDMAHRESA